MNTQVRNENPVDAFSFVSPGREIVLGSLVAVTVAMGAWLAGLGFYAIVWVALIQALYGARWWLSRDSQGERGDKMSIGLLLTGSFWGGAALACFLLSSNAILLSSVYATLAISSILVLCAHFSERSRVLAFVVPAIVPIALAALARADLSAAIVGLSGLVFLFAVMIAATTMEKLAKAHATAHLERTRYAEELQHARLEIKRLEVGAKANSEKRLELEGELSTASSNLQLVEGKADALSNALERVSPYDVETGLLNAKKYVNVITREWARMLRQELPITVVHMVIDNFDDYRETYGKVANEAAIRRIADLMKKTGTRPGDVVARLDENKFALLLPEADHKNGEMLAETLRKQIRRLNLPNKSSTMHSAVTASFGVATVIPNSDLGTEEFAGRADAALYEAQFHGGDKVVRFRTMNSIKLEKWDQDAEGELTPDGLVRKLAILGYDAQPRTFRPGEYQADKRIQIDTIDAIVQGQLKISLEGESRTLYPGDCLFIPKGHVTSIEVVGEKPVICLEGTRV